MQYRRSSEILAGFHAEQPEEALPELFHVGEHWSPISHFISWHTHHTWEFYIQVSGICRWDYGHQLYTMNPGDFFAVAPYVPHTMYEPPPETHHYVYVAVDLEKVFARLPEVACYWQGQRGIFVPHADRLLSSFRQLIREVVANTPYRTLGMRTALDYLVLEASRLVTQQRQPAQSQTLLVSLHPAVQRARELLDYQPGARWQIEDLAHMTGLSPHHLVECFTRDVGISPHQYLLQVRIERAKELLSQSNRAITDLSFELGFSSSQHFSSVFKRVTGQTPLAYRQAQQTSSRLPG